MHKGTTYEYDEYGDAQKCKIVDAVSVTIIEGDMFKLTEYITPKEDDAFNFLFDFPQSLTKAPWDEEWDQAKIEGAFDAALQVQPDDVEFNIFAFCSLQQLSSPVC